MTTHTALLPVALCVLCAPSLSLLPSPTRWPMAWGGSTKKQDGLGLTKETQQLLEGAAVEGSRLVESSHLHINRTNVLPPGRFGKQLSPSTPNFLTHAGAMKQRGMSQRAMQDMASSLQRE